MEEKVVYLIENVTEYGQFLAYLIDRDIHVWRIYWDARANDRCYHIFEDCLGKCHCHYGSRCYYEREGYEIRRPIFGVNEFGRIEVLGAEPLEPARFE